MRQGSPMGESAGGVNNSTLDGMVGNWQKQQSLTATPYSGPKRYKQHEAVSKWPVRPD